MTAAVLRLDDYRPKPPPPPVLFRDRPREEQARLLREGLPASLLNQVWARIEIIVRDLDPARRAELGAEFLANVAPVFGFSGVVFEGHPGGGGSRLVRVRRTKQRMVA